MLALHRLKIRHGIQAANRWPTKKKQIAFQANEYTIILLLKKKLFRKSADFHFEMESNIFGIKKRGMY